MKKIYMMLIVLICIVIVFVSGMLILKGNNIDTSKLDNAGKTFYAKIKEVREYKGIITLLVEGVETNDVNHKGEFTFSVNDTQILWKGTLVSTSYLKEGMLISIGKYDAVQESYPARLVDVESIIILADRLE